MRVRKFFVSVAIFYGSPVCKESLHLHIHKSWTGEGGGGGKGEGSRLDPNLYTVVRTEAKFLVIRCTHNRDRSGNPVQYI